MESTTTPSPTFTVAVAERRTKPGLMASLVFDRPGTPDTHGWYVRVVGADGSALDLSRMDGEDGWTIDATYGPTGLPGFCNGYGARYLATTTLAPRAAALVDQHVATLEQPAEPAAAPAPRCYCPDDCGCKVPWRTNYCGCTRHADG